MIAWMLATLLYLLGLMLAYAIATEGTLPAGVRGFIAVLWPVAVLWGAAMDVLERLREARR